MMNPSLAEGARGRCRKEFLFASNGAVLSALVVAPEEPACVHMAVGHLVSDIRALCHQTVPVVGRVPEGASSPPCLVVVATVGRSALERVATAREVDTSPILGRREAYLIQRVPPAAPAEPHLLALLGADPFGTRRAVYALCERLGMDPMSPLTGFVPPYRPEVSVGDALKPHIGATPPVRWRGVFINDEERIKMWMGDDGVTIPPEVFERLFEAVARSDGNMLAPPMLHSDYMTPETRQRCHDYGIYYTASHMEMLLFNPECPQRPGHWPDPREVPFDYLKQKDRMDAAWRESVRRHRGKLSVWPLGLRDATDAGMVNRDLTREQQADLTRQAVQHQLRILNEELGHKPDPMQDATTITLYKEVLDLYNTGRLEIPPQVIVVWPDDNYGRVRQVPSPEDRRRSPRNGVYYHVGYCRNQWTPWVSPRLLASELGGAIRAGCDEFILVNVSDGREFVHGWRAAMALCSRPELLALAPDDFAEEMNRRFWRTYLGPLYAPEAAALWNRLLELIYRRLPYWHMLYATQTLEAMRGHLTTAPAERFQLPKPIGRDAETGPLFGDEEWATYTKALEALGGDMRSFESRIPQHGRQVFHDQFVVCQAITERVNLWVRGVLSAARALAAADRASAAGHLRSVSGVLDAVDEVRSKAVWGPFKNWYRGDWHDLYLRGVIPGDHPDWSLNPARTEELLQEVLKQLRV